ncbi:two-component system sensor histidine kinase DesK [Actinoplanes lutulentus]|uniref:Two-component system sensor histidine kinase DesK n=1 Tax=Actinoplanes lutulentus TaxID=1287878 RepID=A0A327Z8M7_9ACTN|nr:histidine kinase [Actinoplanes lutulentus]MBB2948460.1 two-component system sensor histidine kinase DesK [Actinoplanes lutulentus]RAK34507.1 two-component system sensor histidine kinase DesK [Actinoplanes lutulentus]
MTPTSRAARVDLTMRASLYVLFAGLPLAVTGQVDATQGTLATLAAGLSALQAVAAVMLLHQSIDYRLGRGPKPRRRIVITAVLSLATVAVAIPVTSFTDGSYAFVTVAVLTSLLVALDPMISTTSLTVLALIGWLVAAGPAIYQDGSRFGAHLTLLLVVAALLITERWTVWTMGVIRQLEEAQQVKAELAVAEERLRFARDLHDVAGRTLSVVALKAELAAQLGKRGRPEAVEEMLEVRRIAQDSLAELRAVVSGLRTARFDEELAGARSLLDAAGISCRVIGDGGGLAERTRATLGWAVREATTNVLRHSRATSCTIELDRAADGTVTLTMINDGADGAGVTHGNGLTGLAERVADAGGTVDAGPVPPDRFRVAVSLPQTREAA